MRKICLDTDFLVALLRNDREAVEKAAEFDAAQVETATTSMNAFEIYLGAYRSLDAQRNLKEAEVLFESISVLSLTRESARKSSEVLSSLLKEGMPVDLRDAIIAGIALTEGYILVTRNIEHFRRIMGLSIERW